MDTWQPDYEPWRHGGWYVGNVRYPSGACGCVSRNYPDRKWRIVCDKRPGDNTYPNRDAAARAEKEIADIECAAAPKCPVCGCAHDGDGCRRYGCPESRKTLERMQASA